MNGKTRPSWTYAYLAIAILFSLALRPSVASRSSLIIISALWPLFLILAAVVFIRRELLEKKRDQQSAW